MAREGDPRPEKVAVVDEVKQKLTASSAALLTEYRGMKVGELAELRRSLRKSGGEFKVYKNTLVRFAVRDLGIDIDEATLTGPTAIAFVEGDAAGVAKALRDYSRTNTHLVLKGGVLGNKALTAAETTALADLPSREVLLAQLAGALQAPLTKLAGLLQALPRNMAYGLKALIDQKVAGGEPAAVSEDIAPAAAPAEADVSENEAVAEEAAAEEAPAADAPAAEAAPESTEATETTETTAEPEASAEINQESE